MSGFTRAMLITVAVDILGLTAAFLVLATGPGGMSADHLSLGRELSFWTVTVVTVTASVWTFLRLAGRESKRRY